MAQSPDRKRQWREQRIARQPEQPKGRRLKVSKLCAVCGAAFHPSHKEQLCCSHVCGGIRAARLKPNHYRMQAANAAKRAAFTAQLAQSLEGLTPLEIYKRGEQRGYRTAHQRFSRHREAA